MEDQRIIRLLRNRAEIAIDALAKKFGKRLMSIAMNILGIYQDAEESVNDTYLAVWNTVPPTSRIRWRDMCMQQDATYH